MRAGILGLVRPGSEPSTTELETQQSGTFAMDVEGETYLDDAATIYHGTATDVVDTNTESIDIADDGSIITERVMGQTRIATEFFADLDAGFVAVNSSDGTVLFDRLAAMNDTLILPAVIDLDSWVKDYRERYSASVWQVGYKHGSDAAGVTYHDDASLDTARDGFTQIGFSYMWRGSPVRGTATRSGYVAIYGGPTNPAQTGRWMRDEVLPYAHIEESGQKHIGDASECVHCGRETDLNDADRCIVCEDALDDEEVRA